jgi:hypothetical protein
MRVLRNFLVVAATAAALGACAPAAEQAELGSPESRTTLLVSNNNWSDMVIYLVRGSTRSRLGSVSSMGTARFAISDAMTGGGYGEIRVMADPIGSDRTWTSPVIDIVPGSQVELTVQNHLATSHFAVY